MSSTVLLPITDSSGAIGEFVAATIFSQSRAKIMTILVLVLLRGKHDHILIPRVIQRIGPKNVSSADFEILHQKMLSFWASYQPEAMLQNMSSTDIVEANANPSLFFSSLVDSIRYHIADAVATAEDILSRPSAAIVSMPTDLLEEAMQDVEDTDLLLSKNIFHLGLYLSHHQNVELPALLTAMEDFKALKQRIEVLRLRGQSLLGRLVSSLSLRESRQSIQQNMSTKRVTQLAFLFLPLSFSTSLFGMNVVELQETRLRVVVVTAVVTLSLSLLLWYATGWLSRFMLLPWANTANVWSFIKAKLRQLLICFDFGHCAPYHGFILALFVMSHTYKTSQRILRGLGLIDIFSYRRYVARAEISLDTLSNPHTWRQAIWQRFWRRVLDGTESYLKTSPRPMKYLWGRAIGKNSDLEPPQS